MSLIPDPRCRRVIVSRKRVDRLGVLLELRENLTLFARLRVLQRLKVLDFSPLGVRHVVPQEVILNRAHALALISAFVHWSHGGL